MNRIQAARQRQGITHPRAEMLPKLADLLKCTVDDLVRSKEAVSQLKK